MTGRAYFGRLTTGAPVTVSGSVQALTIPREDFEALHRGSVAEVSCTVDRRWAAWWDGLFERGYVFTMTARTGSE